MRAPLLTTAAVALAAAACAIAIVAPAVAAQAAKDVAPAPAAAAARATPAGSEQATARARTLALVAQDAVALRAAPRDGAPQLAQLWQGDLLEVRGTRLDYLQVWDHRRERGGYVRAAQVRATALRADAAADLLAVLRFVRDTPGAEALGIATAAAYLKAAPAGAIDAEPFDVIGTLAERLARRASARAGHAGNATLAAHLDVVAQYGVKFATFEREGGATVCYEGDAFRRVLALPGATPEMRTRAALALTRHDCIDPRLAPLQRAEIDRWRGETLQRIGDAELARLAPMWRNRLHLRRAGVWAAIAHQRAREGASPQEAGQHAVDALAAVEKAELTDGDTVDYAEAAVRVGASRWAAEPPPAAAGAAGVPLAGGRLALSIAPGQPGETCIVLTDPRDLRDPRATGKVLARRCTYGTVWPASARAHPGGRALVLAVQPLPTWTELWVFRAGAAGWGVDVLPPAASEPGLGYAEFAGWHSANGAPKLMLAREARVEGRWKRSFEVLALDTLALERSAQTPGLLVAFGRFADAGWKRATVSLR